MLHIGWIFKRDHHVEGQAIFYDHRRHQVNVINIFVLYDVGVRLPNECEFWNILGQVGALVWAQLFFKYPYGYESRPVLEALLCIFHVWDVFLCLGHFLFEYIPLTLATLHFLEKKLVFWHGLLFDTFENVIIDNLYLKLEVIKSSGERNAITRLQVLYHLVVLILEIHQVIIASEVDQLILAPQGENLLSVDYLTSIVNNILVLSFSNYMLLVAKLVQVDLLYLLAWIEIINVLHYLSTSLIELDFDVLTLIFSNVILVYLFIIRSDLWTLSVWFIQETLVGIYTFSQLFMGVMVVHHVLYNFTLGYLIHILQLVKW